MGLSIGYKPNEEQNAAHERNEDNEEHPTGFAKIVQSSHTDRDEGEDEREVSNQGQHPHEARKSIENKGGNNSENGHSDDYNDETQVEEPIFRAAGSAAESNILLET